MQILIKAFAFYAVLFSCPHLFARDLIARKGLLDLRYYNYESGKPVNLNGEWCFAGREFKPDLSLENTKAYANLPEYFKFDDKALFSNHFGHCTYALRVILPHTGKIWALYLPPILSAYKLYINNSLVSQAGTLYPAEKMVPEIRSQIIQFVATTDTVNIDIEVSNYKFVFGGIPTVIRLGKTATLEKEREWSFMISSFLIGSMFIMGLYHFVLFSLRRKDRSYLYFGIICVFIALRESFVGQALFFSHFPSVSFETSVKILYSAFPICLISFVGFFSVIYSDFSKVIRIIVTIPSFIYLIIVVCTANTFYGKYLLLISILFLIQTIYLIGLVTFKAIRVPHQNIIILLALLVLTFCFINDVLYEQQIINSHFLLPFGFFMFVLLQAIMLSVRFTNALRESEHLSVELFKIQMMNKELESKFQQELLKSQLEAQEYSFTQISLEIHDNVGQLLSSAKMLLGTFLQRMENKGSDMLKVAYDTLAKAITELRQLSKSLNRQWLYQFNLIENLESEKLRINSAGNVIVDFSSECNDLTLSSDSQLILFRVVQEALQNCVKHSSATKIIIKIYSRNENFELVIIDNGKGFDYQKVKAQSLGLRSMEYRIRLLSGTIIYQSEPQRGSTIKITIPEKAGDVS